MTAIVATESLLLAVLMLFVVALLRSHAEILRRLENLDPADAVPRPKSAIGRTVGARPRRRDAVRRRPADRRRGNLLLAFLTSGCSSCQRLIDSVTEGIAQLPGSTRLVVVTKSPEVERVRRFQALEKLVDVVMSSRAWDDYAIPGQPLLRPRRGRGRRRRGLGHGVATDHKPARRRARRARETENRYRVDDALLAAGIGAGHPSLHPQQRADG